MVKPICFSKSRLSFISALIFLLLAPCGQAEEAGPYRYLGQFDLGYKYQSMKPDTIRQAYVETVGLNLASLEWHPEEATWMRRFSWLTYLRPRLLYEFTPGRSSEQEEILALSEEPVQAWERLATSMDWDLWGLVTQSPSNSFLRASYDVQSFLVTVEATQDYWFVEDNNARLLIPGDQLNIGTRFVEKSLGLYFRDGVNLYGLGYFETDYNKPISTDAVTPLETIYEADFNARGVFVYWEMSTPQRLLNLSFRYDYAADAKADILNDTSLSQSDFLTSYTPSITYKAYWASLGLNLKQTFVDLPIQLELNYIRREFEQLVEGDQLNKDEILNFSASYRFLL